MTHSRLRLAAQSWAFAALFYVTDYNPLLATSGERRMISAVSLAPLVLAQLAQIFLVALIYAVIVTLTRRFTPWRITQWVVATLTILVLAISSVRPFVPVPIHPGMNFAARWIILPLIIASSPFVARKYSSFALRAKTALGTLFAAFCIFAILVTGELIRVAFWKPAPNQLHVANANPDDPNRSRLVWVVFDELDYYQTYGHRDPALELPNFDHLRAESTLYSDVPPIRNRTFEAIPSFLTGSVVAHFRYTWDNRLLVENENDDVWHPFSVENTAFSTAHRAGLRSAVVGWVIPYCDILRSVIDDCYWTNHDASWDGPRLSSDDSFSHDFWAPLRYMAKNRMSRSQVPASVFYAKDVAQDHARTVEDLKAHALDTLRNSHADVVYIHLPVPHPPTVRDRRTHQFAVGGSYLDGLSHADDVLGELLAVLQSQPRWQQTTLIVQGDHGWRDWEGTWGDEDRKLYHSSPQDVHPLVLVHQPGQNAPETEAQETSLLKVHELAQAVVQRIKP